MKLFRLLKRNKTQMRMRFTRKGLPVDFQRLYADAGRVSCLLVLRHDKLWILKERLDDYEQYRQQNI